MEEILKITLVVLGFFVIVGIMIFSNSSVNSLTPKDSQDNTLSSSNEIQYANISLSELVSTTMMMSSARKKELFNLYEEQYFNGTGILYDITDDTWSTQKIIYLTSLMDESLFYVVYVEPEEYEKIKDAFIGYPISFSAQFQYKSNSFNGLIFYNGEIISR